MPPQNPTPQPDLTKNPGSPPSGPATPPPQITTPLPQIPASPPRPRNPANQFDFMLQDPQATGSKFRALSTMSKPVLILSALAAIVLVSIILGLVFGSSNNYPQILDLAAETQEIARVSNAYHDKFADQANLNISVTAATTVTGQQHQYLTYLASNKYKYKSKLLGAHANKNTDATLLTAYGKNQFDSAYISYLSSALQHYQNSIKTVEKTSTKNFAKVLETAYKNNQVLLTSTQFTSQQ